jgi:hypothetical protein
MAKKKKEESSSLKPKLSSFLDKKVDDISFENEELCIYFHNGYAIVIKGSNISISVQEKKRPEKT